MCCILKGRRVPRRDPHALPSVRSVGAQGYAGQVASGDQEPGCQPSTIFLYLHTDTSPGTCLTALLKWAVNGP